MKTNVKKTKSKKTDSERRQHGIVKKDNYDNVRGNCQDIADSARAGNSSSA